MNRELEIRERVALYGLELTGHDREALDIARGNLEFYAYSDLRYLLSETARLCAELDAAQRRADDAKTPAYVRIAAENVFQAISIGSDYDLRYAVSDFWKAWAEWRGPDAPQEAATQQPDQGGEDR